MVARNTLRFNISFISLIEQINSAPTRVTLYHRYAKWQRFLVNVEEDLCKLFTYATTPVLSTVFPFLAKLTNMNHACPYEVNQTYFVASDRFNASIIKLPLLPSGKYRVDLKIALNKNEPFCLIQMYFDISDHRVWQH